MRRILDPMPVLDRLAKECGGLTEAVELYFDEELNLKPGAPADLVEEIQTIRSKAKIVQRLP